LPDELVVYGDVSQDGTVVFLDAFACSAPFRGQILHNERTPGYGQNSEKATLLCLRRIIVFKAKGF
jgi:hypothetical protein